MSENLLAKIMPPPRTLGDTRTIPGPARIEPPDEPMCEDFESDCAEVRCKRTCYEYAPERGWCPYLLGSPTSSPL